MPSPSDFSVRLRAVRLSKVNELGRPMSQVGAAFLFRVHLSTYQKWEAGQTLPDPRSRERMCELWPEVFVALRVAHT